MPVYHYKCEECVVEFETVHSIKEPIWKICPDCKNESLRVVLDSPPTIMNVGEVKTIGQLAERNAKSMGRYGLEETMARDGTAQKIKEKEKMKEARKIASLSPEKKTKYIETGKF
jgi:hypothetical protein